MAIAATSLKLLVVVLELDDFALTVDLVAEVATIVLAKTAIESLIAAIALVSAYEGRGEAAMAAC